MSRYVYRVIVNGGPVRCYQTLRAAQYRACEWSRRQGYEDAVISVDRSEPVTFASDDGTLVLRYSYRNGVLL